MSLNTVMFSNVIPLEASDMPQLGVLRMSKTVPPPTSPVKVKGFSIESLSLNVNALNNKTSPSAANSMASAMLTDETPEVTFSTGFVCALTSDSSILSEHVKHNLGRLNRSMFKITLKIKSHEKI